MLSFPPSDRILQNNNLGKEEFLLDHGFDPDSLVSSGAGPTVKYNIVAHNAAFLMSSRK